MLGKWKIKGAYRCDRKDNRKAQPQEKKSERVRGTLSAPHLLIDMTREAIEGEATLSSGYTAWASSGRVLVLHVAR